MTKYYIRNTTEEIIREFKPGIGEFVFRPGEDYLINDVMGTMKTPIKTEVSYVQYPAKQVAEAIINDFARKGLQVVTEEE
jgi:hypothetical protein